MYYLGQQNSSIPESGSYAEPFQLISNAITSMVDPTETYQLIFKSDLSNYIIDASMNLEIKGIMLRIS